MMATLFDNFPQFDPSDLHLPELDFPLDGLTSDLDLDFDLDDISIDDLLLPAPDSSLDPDLDPDPHPPSPESDNLPSSSSSAVTNRVGKRKMEEGDGASPSPNPKLRRSDEAHSASSSLSGGGGGEDEKRKARLMRNRESAQLSRQRRKHYVGELEGKVRAMSSTIADLNGKISFYMAENARLHHQLTAGSGGATAAPPPPMPPHVPLHPAMRFPWIPYSGYPVLPGGARVPLVPIPRLQPQQPAPALAPTESRRRGEGKGRMKKIASFSFIGLFLLLSVFGGALNFVFEDRIGSTASAGGKDRVLSISGRKEGSNRTEEIGFKPNSSESMPALLYVPRNGKRVEINGNLIIHSVLASERALAEAKSVDKTKQSSGKEVTDLAIPGNVALALAAPKSERDLGRHLKAYRNMLASDSQGAVKSTPVDGPLQQWFREGLAGPILSSGTCTEVFQFEISPSSANPSGIVPATSVVNATEKLPPGKMKNRRILYPHPIPLAGSTINDTHHFGKPSENNTFHPNSTVPSMVVSVMADPREAGDGDCDRVITPKSLTRIFVVVLMDSVKYVTYSCMLPLKSSGPHLVN